MSEIDPALVERMREHLVEASRMVPNRPSRDTAAQSMWDELQEIIALLPKPVDPDLIEARSMATGWQPNIEAVQEILNGAWDNTKIVCQALSAIKRGRELERGA